MFGSRRHLCFVRGPFPPLVRPARSGRRNLDRVTDSLSLLLSLARALVLAQVSRSLSSFLVDAWIFVKVSIHRRVEFVCFSVRRRAFRNAGITPCRGVAGIYYGFLSSSPASSPAATVFGAVVTVVIRK